MHGETTDIYRPVWAGMLRVGWKTGLVLVLLWTIPRFWLVLDANRSGSYRWIPLIFLSMMALPFVLLNRQGRKQMGLNWPRFRWLAVALLLGMAVCALMYVGAVWIFGLGPNHWLTYVAASYTQLPDPMNDGQRQMFFWIYCGIGAFFSPIGEEFFYRGLIHEHFKQDMGETRARLVDSLAFSVVHLAHFGVVFTAAGWQFLLLPSLFWTTSLFCLCLAFSELRQRSGSIAGAVVAHAGFNIGMNYFIFYHVLI